MYTNDNLVKRVHEYLLGDNWIQDKKATDNWGHYYTKRVNQRLFVIIVTDQADYYFKRCKEIFPYSIIPSRYGVTDAEDVLTIFIGSKFNTSILGPNFIVIYGNDNVETTNRVVGPFKEIQRGLERLFAERRIKTSMLLKRENGNTYDSRKPNTAMIGMALLQFLMLPFAMCGIINGLGTPPHMTEYITYLFADSSGYALLGLIMFIIIGNAYKKEECGTAVVLVYLLGSIGAGTFATAVRYYTGSTSAIVGNLGGLWALVGAITVSRFQKYMGFKKTFIWMLIIIFYTSDALRTLDNIPLCIGGLLFGVIYGLIWDKAYQLIGWDDKLKRQLA